jgi:hypothetical protein
MFNWLGGFMSCMSKCYLVRRVEDIGRARQFLENVLEHEIFNKTSKHNPYWESIHEEECDKLQDLRMIFGCLNDNLWHLMEILRPQDEADA